MPLVYLIDQLYTSKNTRIVFLEKTKNKRLINFLMVTCNSILCLSKEIVIL